MAGQTVDYIVRVRGATDASVDQAVAKLKQFVNAQEDVAVSAEKVSRAQLSAEKSLERWSRSLDMNFRQMREVEKLQKDLTRAREAGRNVDQEAARLTALLTEKHQAASRAQKSLADTTKLSRYELINLSRQVQDVGVGLASGQSPFTVLIQQGTQIADVFAASQTTVRQFFTQAIGWAGRFATSTAGVVTGATAIGASALLAAQHWSSGQIEIDRALTGVGKAAGITRTEINALAESSAQTSAISLNEARQAAVIFASTGEIYSDNIKLATSLTKDFARATGTDVTTAAKTMAAALADPAKGAMELNKQLQFLDAGTLSLIETLESQNKKQEAQKVLLNAASDSIREQAKNVDILTKIYDHSVNTLSKWLDLYGKVTARGIQQTAQAAGAVVGPSLGGMSQEEELAGARQKLQARQQSVFQGPLARVGLANAIEEVGRLEAEFARLGRTMEEARFAKLSLEAKEFTESLIPQVKAIQQIEKGLAKIRDARASTIKQDPITGAPVQGGPALAHEKELDVAEKIGRARIADLKESQALQARQVELALKLRETYGGFSLDTAKTLELQKTQLSVAQAITGTQQLNAQEAARITQLVLEGRREEEAIVIAAGERQIAQAKINAEAAGTLRQLERQLPVVSATTEAAKMNAEQHARVNELLDRNVGIEQALAIAGAERALKQAAITAEAQKNIAALERQAPISAAVTETARMEAQERARIVELLDASVPREEALRTAALERSNHQAQITAGAERQLQALEMQQGVAEAVTGAARMEAQERATIAQLLQQAVPLAQAIAIAEQQTANTQAALNAGAMQRLEQLRDQERIIKAVSEEERNREKANATLNDLLRQGVDALEAQLVADQQLANAEEQRHQRENDAIEREQAAQARSLATSRERLRVERMRAEAAAEAADQAETEAAHQRRIASGQTLAGEFFGPNTGGTGRTFTGISNIRLARQITEQQALGREAVPVPGKGGINQILFRETDTSIRNMINDLLRTGGDLSQAIKQISELPGDVLSNDLRFSILMDLMRRQTELTGSSAEEIAMLRQQIGQVGNQPRSLEQMDLLKTLNDRLKQLTEATENLNASMVDILSPLYTSDPRMTHLGFRAGSRPLNYDPFKQPIVVPTTTPSPPTPTPSPPMDRPMWPGITPAPDWWVKGLPPPSTPLPGPVLTRGPNPTWGLTYEEMLRLYRGGTGGPLHLGVPRAQYGLSGVVTGSGGTDSTLVQLMATPGERVIVTPQTPAPTSWGKERGLQQRPNITIIQNFRVAGDIDRDAVRDLKMSAFQGAQQAQRRGSLG